MKKAIVIPAVSLVTVGLIGTGAILLAPKEAQMNINNTPQTVQEAPQEPEPVKTNEEPVSEPQTVQEPVQPVQEERVPTNEELIVQYGWKKEPYITSINSIMQMVPQYFTDDERVAAFKYLDDACNRGGQNLSFCLNYMLAAKGPKELLWVNIGKRVGVDTSRYE